MPKKNGKIKKKVIIPPVNELIMEDFKSDGKKKTFNLTKAAASVIEIIKNEIDSKENATLNNLGINSVYSFVSDAIIYFSKKTIDRDKLGEAIKNRRFKFKPESYEKRVMLLEKSIARLALKQLDNDDNNFNKMKDIFFKKFNDIKDGDTLHQYNILCEQDDITEEDKPLWAILIYANKYKMLKESAPKKNRARS